MHSQLGQDIFCLTFYNNKREGYFLDIGACDGVSFSNSYLLEDEYKWKGLLIEPMKSIIPVLKEKRPNSMIIEKAAYSESGKILSFCENRDDKMISGLDGYVDKEFQVKQYNKVHFWESYDVETVTISDLLKEHKYPQFIEYVSLDVEGAELEVLKGMDFQTYTYGIMNIEHNYVEPRRSQIKELLLENGYIYRCATSFDDDYIHRSMIEGTYYFCNDYTKPITVTIDKNNTIHVSSPYWPNDSGVFEGKLMGIRWNRLGAGKLFHNRIDYGNGNIWHR